MHTAGGGSGGRIGIYSDETLFVGTYSAQGGSSPATMGYGGPGSIYLEFGKIALDNLERMFIISNENGQKYMYLTLNEDSKNIVFENLYIENFAKFQVTDDEQQRNLTVVNVNGDGTGLIRLRKNQIGSLERIQSGNNTASKLDVNLELHDGGEFLMSESTTLMGLADVALDLDGVLRGAMNLQVARGRTMKIGANARIVPFYETELSKKANITFGTFQLDPGSFVELAPDVGTKMLVSEFYVKFTSQIKGDSFEVIASNLDIEMGAIFSCSGYHRTESEAIDISTGAGTSNGGTYYGGAGHGGESGEQFGRPDTTGKPYDSLYNPSMPGSRSHDNGGHGGGYIKFKIGGSLIIDGTLMADGEGSKYGGMWCESFFHSTCTFFEIYLCKFLQPTCVLISQLLIKKVFVFIII